MPMKGCILTLRPIVPLDNLPDGVRGGLSVLLITFSQAIRDRQAKWVVVRNCSHRGCRMYNAIFRIKAANMSECDARAAPPTIICQKQQVRMYMSFDQTLISLSVGRSARKKKCPQIICCD